MSEAKKYRYLGEAPDDYPFWKGKDGSFLTAGQVRRMSDAEKAEWKVEQGYICGARLSGGWITNPGYCERGPGHIQQGLKHKASVGCWPDGWHDEYWGPGVRDLPKAAS